MSPAASGPPAPDRRQVLLGGALIAATATAAVLRPRRTIEVQNGRQLDAIVPLTIGDYRYASSSGLILPDVDQTKGIYDQVMTRIYVAGTAAPMMLLIAYGSAQDAGLAVHRPEACYPSSGYAIGDRADAALSGVPGRTATVLTAARGDRVEQVYFWTRIGRRFPTSSMEEKWAVFSENLGGVLPDGVLVRLSVRSTDRLSAVAQMMTFNALLLQAGGDAGRRLLLGAGVAR